MLTDNAKSIKVACSSGISWISGTSSQALSISGSRSSNTLRNSCNSSSLACSARVILSASSGTPHFSAKGIAFLSSGGTFDGSILNTAVLPFSSTRKKPRTHHLEIRARRYISNFCQYSCRLPARSTTWQTGQGSVQYYTGMNFIPVKPSFSSASFSAPDTIMAKFHSPSRKI